jgi:hypothetical protein
MIARILDNPWPPYIQEHLKPLKTAAGRVEVDARKLEFSHVLFFLNQALSPDPKIKTGLSYTRTLKRAAEERGLKIIPLLNPDQLARTRRPEVLHALRESLGIVLFDAGYLQNHAKEREKMSTPGRVFTELLIRQYGYLLDHLHGQNDLNTLFARAFRQQVQNNDTLGVGILRADLYPKQTDRSQS